VTFLLLLVVATCLLFLWSANPVHGVLTLVVVGCALATGLLIHGLEFTALLVLLVYVGAVTVLFVFVVMMVNLRATPVAYVTAEAIVMWLILAVGLAAGAANTSVNTYVSSELILLTGHLNLSTVGYLLYATESVAVVAVVGLVLFTAMISAICLSLVSGENYRTQEFYSQIRKSNAVFVLQ